jgi:precorrin-6Y C5,15-methyltransferase (decarboxylating)
VINIVGLGAGGWPDLTGTSREVLRSAQVVLGGARQLALLDDSVTGLRVAWPSPLVPALPGLLEAYADQRVAVLASGDPMFFGIGSNLVELVGPDRVRVFPHVSSVSLAAARLGWSVAEVEVLSAVGRPLSALSAALAPGRRVFVLVGTSSGARDVVALLAARGYGSSPVRTLAQLGGPDEQVTIGAQPHDALAIVAVECRADAGLDVLPRTPGLPDDAFETDGQLTKREVRALALAALGPVPGQLLWDIGAGSGSIGIEWLRTHPACRAIAIEPRADRSARIAANADRLGVPGLQIVAGFAPNALVGLPAPDAVFVGGAVSRPGVIDAAVAALGPGGRLVANAVTVESESVLAAWRARLGGHLTRIAVQRAEPVGAYTGWRPAMPVTQWAFTKR